MLKRRQYVGIQRPLGAIENGYMADRAGRASLVSVQENKSDVAGSLLGWLIAFTLGVARRLGDAFPAARA